MLNHTEPVAQIMAVVLPDGSPESPAALNEFVATGTMLLVRHADGRWSLEPARQVGISRYAVMPMGSSSSRRPILDPVSREVLGYELELPLAC